MKFKLNAETVRAVLQAEDEVLSVDHAPSSLSNPDFIAAELRGRGYEGVLTKTVTLTI